MTKSFVAYIDESGDEGFKFLPDDRGSSRWLVVSAVVLRKARDLEVVRIMREIRDTLQKPRDKALHFRELKHEQRLPFIRKISGAPARIVSVLIHKPSISEPERFQSEPHRLYRYACRLLLERVSWLCRDSRKPGEGEGSVELIFSNRSAMSYDDLRNYLRLLKAQSAASQDVRIDWAVIDPDAVSAVNHEKLAGLQIADAVASGVYCAVNLSQYGEVEPRYLDMMRPLIYQHDSGNCLGYGLKLWPVDLGSLLPQLPHLECLQERQK
jgi:hypothetical protein